MLKFSVDTFYTRPSRLNMAERLKGFDPHIQTIDPYNIATILEMKGTPIDQNFSTILLFICFFF